MNIMVQQCCGNKKLTTQKQSGTYYESSKKLLPDQYQFRVYTHYVITCISIKSISVQISYQTDKFCNNGDGFNFHHFSTVFVKPTKNLVNKYNATLERNTTNFSRPKRMNRVWSWCQGMCEVK